MAEALDIAADDAPPRKKLLARLLPPLLFLIVGAGAGVGGAMLAPVLLPGAGQGGEKPATPAIMPLEYVQIDNSFTASLKDTGRYVQLRIAISTHGGKPVVDAVNRHNVAIIAAVLSVLSDSREAELNAPGGRDRLARNMRLAINDLLQRKSGLAGVDDVFLTSFIVQ